MDLKFNLMVMKNVNMKLTINNLRIFNLNYLMNKELQLNLDLLNKNNILID